MSKAEDFAVKKYPVSIEDAYGHKVDVNLWQRKAYIKGYRQAEKDLELTWEDLKLLQDISHEVVAEVAKGSVDYYQIYPTQQSFFKEVLKRFKERREK